MKEQLKEEPIAVHVQCYSSNYMCPYMLEETDEAKKHCHECYHPKVK